MAVGNVAWDTTIKGEISAAIREVGKCMRLVAARENAGNSPLSDINDPARDLRVVGVATNVWGILSKFEYGTRGESLTKALRCTCHLDPQGVTSISIGDFIVDGNDNYVIESYMAEKPAKEYLVYVLSLRRG